MVSGPVTAAAGLFETDSDVRLYAGRVDAQITGLDNDLRASFRAKYGPSGLGGTAVDNAALAEQKSDKAFYDSWSPFLLAWQQTKRDIDESFFIVLSANKYREVEKYDVDSQAWRARIAKRGVHLNTPPLTQGGAIPGITAPQNPDVPQQESLAGAIVGDLVRASLIAGAGYLAFQFISKKIKERGSAAPALKNSL
jgi:hypothetical protein